MELSRLKVVIDGAWDGAKKAFDGVQKGSRDTAESTTRNLGMFRAAAGTVFDGFTRLAKTAFKTVAVAGGAAFAGLSTTAAMALKGGLNRVLSTEDATVQMKRMGLSMKQVDQVLKDVDDTFSGTPFANPDGFNVSAQLYASGVELSKVKGILGTVADFAAHGNVPLTYMSDLFVRIASQGKVTAEELNRLSDRNIPLTQVAKALGMSVTEMRELASEGELTSDMFFKATADVKMFQGAAKAAGDTTRGAFGNVKTAIATLGDKFLTPLFGENGHAVTGLKRVREGIRGLYPMASQVGTAFAEWLVPAVGSLVSGIGPLGSRGKELFDSFRPVVGMASELAPSLLQVAGIAGQTLRRALVELVPHLRRLVPHITSLAKTVGEGATELMDRLVPAIGAVLPNLVEFASTLFEKLLPVAEELIPTVVNVAATFGEVLSKALNTVLPILTTVIEFLGPILQTAASGSGPILAALLGGFLAFKTVTGIFGAVAGVVKLVTGAVAAFNAVLLANPIGLVVAAVAALVAGIIYAYHNVEGFRNLVDGAWQLLQSVARWLGSAFITAIRGVGAAFKTVGDAATSAAGWVRDQWDRLVSFIRSIPGRIGSAATGMFDGIKNAFKSVLNFIIDGWNRLEFKLPSFSGKKIAGRTVIPGWEGPTLGMPKIPRLAEGGIALPTPGGVLANIAEAGEAEAVIPLSKLPSVMAGMSPAQQRPSVTVVIEGPVYGMDDFEEKVAEAAEKAFDDHTDELLTAIAAR